MNYAGLYAGLGQHLPQMMNTAANHFDRQAERKDKEGERLRADQNQRYQNVMMNLQQRANRQGLGGVQELLMQDDEAFGIAMNLLPVASRDLLAMSNRELVDAQHGLTPVQLEDGRYALGVYRKDGGRGIITQRGSDRDDDPAETYSREELITNIIGPSIMQYGPENLTGLMEVALGGPDGPEQGQAAAPQAAAPQAAAPQAAAPQAAAPQAAAPEPLEAPAAVAPQAAVPESAEAPVAAAPQPTAEQMRHFQNDTSGGFNELSPEEQRELMDFPERADMTPEQLAFHREIDALLATPDEELSLYERLRKRRYKNQRTADEVAEVVGDMVRGGRDGFAQGAQSGNAAVAAGEGIRGALNESGALDGARATATGALRNAGNAIRDAWRGQQIDASSLSDSVRPVEDRRSRPEDTSAVEANLAPMNAAMQAQYEPVRFEAGTSMEGRGYIPGDFEAEMDQPPSEDVQRIMETGEIPNSGRTDVGGAEIPNTTLKNHPERVIGNPRYTLAQQATAAALFYQATTGTVPSNLISNFRAESAGPDGHKALMDQLAFMRAQVQLDHARLKYATDLRDAEERYGPDSREVRQETRKANEDMLKAFKNSISNYLVDERRRGDADNVSVLFNQMVTDNRNFLQHHGIPFTSSGHLDLSRLSAPQMQALQAVSMTGIMLDGVEVKRGWSGRETLQLAGMMDLSRWPTEDPALRQGMSNIQEWRMADPDGFANAVLQSGGLAKMIEALEQGVADPRLQRIFSGR